MTQSCVLKGVGGADDAGLFTLCKDDAFLGAFEYRTLKFLQEACCGIEALRKGGAVGIHVRDRLAGHTGIHRRLSDEGRNIGHQPRVEGAGDNVFRAKLQLHPVIGGSDLVRHILAGQLGQSVSAGDLHLHVHPPGPHIKRATEDVGEAQHVIDLIGIVRSPGADDGVGAYGVNLLRCDFRVGIGHGED